MLAHHKSSVSWGTKKEMNMKNEFSGCLCPNCNKKGLHYANHPDALGYKDYKKVVCRFCHERFIAHELIQYLNGEIHMLHQPK